MMSNRGRSVETKGIKGDHVKPRGSKGRPTDEEKLRKEILKLMNKGMSINAIAKTLRISRNTVRYHIRMAEVENLKEEYRRKIRALQRQEEELRKNYEQKFRELQELERKLKERERLIIQEADRVYQEELRKRQEDIRRLEEEIKRLRLEENKLKERINLLRKEAEKISEEIATLKKKREKLKLELESMQKRYEKIKKSIRLKVDIFKNGFNYIAQFYVNIPVDNHDLKYDIVKSIKELRLKGVWKVITGDHVNAKKLEGYNPLFYVEILDNIIEKERDKAKEIIERLIEETEKKIKEYKEFEDFIESLKVEKILTV